MNTERHSSLLKDFEIFLCWYAGAYLLSALITGLGVPYSITHMVNEGGTFSSGSLISLATMSSHLIGVVTAIWLWKREYSSNRSRIIWTIFGLASALWAVGLYFLVVLVADRVAIQTVSEHVDSETK